MKNLVCPRKDEIDECVYLNGTLLRNGFYKIGLFVGQPVILEIIEKNPGLTQKVLADIGGVKPSTINVMLARMAKNGLVQIQKDKANAKFSKVYITEKGKDLSNKAVEYKEYIEKMRFKDFSETEMETFKNLLNKVNTNLKFLLEEEKINENN